MIFNPSAGTAVEASDFLIVMGEADPLRRLEARVSGVVR
jgi:K+/H+ antiporter YhaU regulatory subunit KhtT